MPLLKFDNLSLAYGHHALLDHANLIIEPGERIALVGRNGAGKSTLLKIISGEVLPDDGSVWRESGLRTARLQQDVPAQDERSVFQVVTAGLGELVDLLSEYHEVAHALENSSDEQLFNRLSRLQNQLEAADGWRIQQRVDSVISQLSLPADKRINELSGGWRRRALLAQALVREPDLLLLDEPTNHLDVESILWLEEFLISQRVSLLFITHDRAFLRRLATRILDLDRGHLSSWPGDYDNYLRRQEERLAAEASANAEFDKKLAEEEVWIRQGIKARRTRNEGRVRRLESLREERSARRERQGRVSMDVDSGKASGKLVFEAEHVSYAWEGEPLIKDFSCTILRGDRIGLLGPNGSGKSSLLQVLQGLIKPDSGTVRQGTNLQIAYFDKQREQLNTKVSVLDNVAEGRDTVEVNGRSRHVISYLRDFLFEPERLHSPVSSLSGGERNRLLLAKLFAKPANVLILDEPTNDLDMETLELLESLLVEYDGTLLIVSHDREFLDNVVTSTLAFEGHGRIDEYVGGYQDYLRQRKPAEPVAEKSAAKKPAEAKPKAAPAKKKLSYKEQRELESLPATIEALENEQAELQAQTSDADFYKQDKDSIAQVMSRMEQLQAELENAYARWDALESD